MDDEGISPEELARLVPAEHFPPGFPPVLRVDEDTPFNCFVCNKRVVAGDLIVLRLAPGEEPTDDEDDQLIVSIHVRCVVE